MFCGQPGYLAEKRAVQSTWGADAKAAGYRHIFYAESPDGQTRLDGDTLLLPCPPGLAGTYEKTALALRYVEEHFDYDAVVKTNVSTYVNVGMLGQMLEYRERNEPEAVYGSRLLLSMSTAYLRGDFTVMGRPVCRDIAAFYERTKAVFPRGGVDDRLMFYFLYWKYGKEFCLRMKTVPTDCRPKYDYLAVRNSVAVRLKTSQQTPPFEVADAMREFHRRIKAETRPFKFRARFNEAQVKRRAASGEFEKLPREDALRRALADPNFGKARWPRPGRTAVYTCITGGYDTLKPVPKPGTGIDYVCFTDRPPDRPPSPWKCRPIPQELAGLSDVRKQRTLKILPHRYLPEYDASLWVDANIHMDGDMGAFFGRYDLRKSPLYTNRHPLRDCVYQERDAVVKLGKDTAENVRGQMDKILAEGYPEHNGLAETNIMLRDHFDPLCRRAMEAWAAELAAGSHRDQLSFDYSCWKVGLRYARLAETYRKKLPGNTFNLVKHDGPGAGKEKTRQDAAEKAEAPKPAEPKPAAPRIVPFRTRPALAIVVINRDTPELVDALLESVRLHPPAEPYDAVVIDNSRNGKYRAPDWAVLVDNTRGSFVDEDAVIAATSATQSKNGYASYRHAMSVQWALDSLQYDKMVFLDSDVLVKKRFDFADGGAAVAAEYTEAGWSRRPRFEPYVMYVNAKAARKAGLRYLDPARMHGGSDPVASRTYDTGCSFCEDVFAAGLPVRAIKWGDYAVHLGGGSWRRGGDEQKAFLEENAALWKAPPSQGGRAEGSGRDAERRREKKDRRGEKAGRGKAPGGRKVKVPYIPL